MKDKINPRYKTTRQHMSVHWHDIIRKDSDIPAVNSELKEKTTLVGRVGSMFLSLGTSAWRVRGAMNKISRDLGISCNVSIGLTSITFTCIEGSNHYSQTIALPTTGVNTTKLMYLEYFVDDFASKSSDYSAEQFHQILDRIEKQKGNYQPWLLGLAAGFACAAFTFLLGGGIIEIICAFFGAGLGNFIRKLLLEKKITLLANVSVSVFSACTVYVLLTKLGELLFNISTNHQAGYICAMLFIIPGFPLITGGIDMAKLDLKSGLERIAYALIIISTATLTGWATALIFNFNPGDFPAQELGFPLLLTLRIVASFVGIFGFSLMFNSTYKMALFASVIGTAANILRLEIMDVFEMPIALATFIGALTAGLLASVIDRNSGVPRISMTVPSIVIMVPGMFMYKAVYYIGLNDISTGGLWLTKALFIVMALPLGLVAARILTDSYFRHSS